MDIPRHPIVHNLPSPQFFSPSHHGPPKPKPKSKGKSKTNALTPADPNQPEPPKYFINPWPSYRMAFLSDAWAAYQRGAAIAPRHAISRPASPSCSHSHSHMAPDEEGESDEEEQRELLRSEPEPGPDATAAQWSLWRARSVYIRPEFSKMHEEDEEDDWRDPPVQVVRPDWDEGDKVDVTWLGHAGVLIRIPWKGKEKENGRKGMCGVLFDPIFSYRCSPSQYVGPARYLDPPCTIAELPEIHVCCISHDHYDHLDYYTIMDLWKHHVSTIHFFVPFGLKAWFTSSGIPSTRVTELDWWHESILSFPSSNANPETSPRYHSPRDDVPTTSTTDTDAALTLKIAFTPAQHRSGRGLLDHMTTLWGSWCLGVVEEDDLDKAGEQGMKGWKGFKAFFGGDTGYRYASAPEGDDSSVCPAFEEIASHYSPFTLSLLPISTGSSLPFLRNVLSLSLDQYTLTSSHHCSPADSLAIHEILGSERSLGIHWGTFCDEDEARGTRVDLGRCRRERGIGRDWEGGEEGGESREKDGEEGEGVGRGKGCFVVADIGETLVLP